MIRFLIIDLFRRTTIVFEYFKIKREFNSTGKLKTLQLKNLSNFLIRLKKNQAFGEYIKSYTDKEILHDPIQILEKLPITDKEFVTNNFNKIFNKKNKNKFEFNYTGGSTGSPFKYVIDKITISRVRAFNYFLWNYYLGYKFGNKILVIGGSSLGANKSLKKRIYNLLQNKKFVPGDLVDSSQIKKNLELIMKSNYQYIYAYPTSLIMYIRLAIKLNIEFKGSINGIITTSEMLFEKDKKLIEKFFSTEVLNVYGANDGGLISGSKDNNKFLFNGLDCFIEEVKNNLTNNSELILTNLNSESFPFVRYKVGDVGKLLIPEQTGWPFYIIDLGGRTRDFIKNSKGSVFHGSLINKILKECSGIIKYQLIQDSSYNISFLVQTSSMDIFRDLKLNIEQSLKELIADPDIEINVSYTDSFISSQNNKHKLIISDAN